MTNADGREKKKRGFGLRVDAFELLYIAISIATFSHTVWASSFAFEGPPPKDPGEMVIWQFKGSLIAIAIDLGMLLSARFIAKSDKVNKSMVLAFIVAACSSFYTQLLYIIYHTGSFPVGSGVDPYWNQALSPLVSARVVILPFLLPFLGIIYTVARTSREKEEATKEAIRVANAPITVTDVLKKSSYQGQLEQSEASGALPPPNEELIIDSATQTAIELFGDTQIDRQNWRWFDKNWNQWSHPHESEAEMVKKMKTLAKRRQTMLNNRGKKKPSD